MSSHFFRKSRLKTAEDFSAVFDKKEARINGGEFTIYFCYNNLSYPRLGVIAAKKRLKKAVARNFFKRVVRETFRLNQTELKGIDLVVVANKEISPERGKEMAKNLENQLSKLMR